MQFVLSYKTWSVNPGAWLARPPPACQPSQDSSPVSSMVRSQQGGRALTVQPPGRLEARSEACSALSLKPKQDYLISLRVSSTLIYRIGILTCLCNEEEEEEKKLLGLKSWTRIQVY